MYTIGDWRLTQNVNVPTGTKFSKGEKVGTGCNEGKLATNIVSLSLT
jgi:hypothetical protein